ncbi:hypothetical protein T09_7509, partial [Trichinella sp. T9]
LREYANFYLPWGIAWGESLGLFYKKFEIFRILPEA